MKRSTMMRIGVGVVLLVITIGLIVAWQTGYFTKKSHDVESSSTSPSCTAISDVKFLPSVPQTVQVSIAVPHDGSCIGANLEYQLIKAVDGGTLTREVTIPIGFNYVNDIISGYFVSTLKRGNNDVTVKVYNKKISSKPIYTKNLQIFV